MSPTALVTVSPPALESDPIVPVEVRKLPTRRMLFGTRLEPEPVLALMRKSFDVESVGFALDPEVSVPFEIVLSVTCLKIIAPRAPK